MYVLDTNALTELWKSNERTVEWYYRVTDNTPVVTTLVTWFEVVRGRYASILTAADRGQLLLAQTRLQQDLSNLDEWEILTITEPVADQFEQLRSRKGLKKIGRDDLLVACIVLAHRATLVTRNTKDFAGIPGLKLENWAA